MARLQPISQHNFLVSIAGFESFWSQFSGVEEGSESSTFNDGLSKRNRTVLGPLTLENVTLEKPFDPEQDAALVQQIYDLRYTRQDLTVTVEPVRRTRNGTERIGTRSWTLQGCQIVRFMGAEVDTESSDVSKLELELSVDEVVYN